MADLGRFRASRALGDGALHALDQRFELTCRDGRWIANLSTSLQGSDNYTTRGLGTGYSPENALRDALQSLVSDEEDDDDRDTLVDAFEPGEQILA